MIKSKRHEHYNSKRVETATVIRSIQSGKSIRKKSLKKLVKYLEYELNHIIFMQEIWLDEIIKATFALQLKEYIHHKFTCKQRRRFFKRKIRRAEILISVHKDIIYEFQYALEVIYNELEVIDDAFKRYQFSKSISVAMFRPSDL